MARSTLSAQLLIESRMEDALEGDPGACFDMGIALSSGSDADTNLVEAHKWFDLAARAGYAPAEPCRAALAWQMSLRQLDEARRLASMALLSRIQQAARFSAIAFS